MKSFSFLFITIFAALIIAGTAALFSVTGISTIFSAHFVQVAIMAGSLETGKIVISSILYRYWKIMNRVIKTYMIAALLVLMLITSAGIFGYLSEAYQKTKSGYDVVGKEVELLTSKKQLFQNEYDRYQKRLNDLTNIRVGQETRLDSLYSRGQTSTARRIETDIKRQDLEIADLNSKLLVVSDSLSSIETKLVEKQSTIITGDLGPLQYVAKAFGTDMDTTVKFFILILIFVFDPLAVTLIVAANMIYINKHYEREEWTGFFMKNKNKKVEKQMEEAANEYLTKEEVKDIFPDDKSVEALPADKNALMINTEDVKNTQILQDEIPDLTEEDKQQLREFDAWRNEDINNEISDVILPLSDTKVPIIDANSQPPEVKKDESDIQTNKQNTPLRKWVHGWKSANWRDPE